MFLELYCEIFWY